MSRNRLAGIIIACTVAIIAVILLVQFDACQRTHTLSVTVSPPQAGYVSPAGGEYESGAEVTLTAYPASGYAFDYWGGAGSGSLSTVVITMNSDRTLIAYFSASGSPPTDSTQGSDEPPPGAISWYEAKEHIGERTTVCGPVRSTYYCSSCKGKPTFLNIGEPYPDPDRFTVIIWGENRGNFPTAPETYYEGKHICVRGLIVPYEDVAEIEVTTPGQIELQ